ncbi:MAG: SDR family oxidoreductase [Anaerolineaceae bacterium]|nr:SDR family oxidoreductase [Anaerolineaceae bacterium]
MKGKTILITGATDGIGKQTALRLAEMGAHVLLHGRNPKKAEQVRQEIISKSGNSKVEVFIADLQSLKQVRQLASDVKKSTNRLDVLINNAGVYIKKRRLSEDGYEMTFAINYLAPFLLTNLLLDLLKKSAPARVVTVSSIGHKLVYLNMADLQGKFFFWDWVAYCRSKLLNVLFTFELSERLKGTGVAANAVHPGVITTNLLKKAKIGSSATVEDGADPIVYLATSPELNNVSGKYFNRKQISKANILAGYFKLRKKLWTLSMQLSGLK